MTKLPEVVEVVDPMIGSFVQHAEAEVEVEGSFAPFHMEQMVWENMDLDLTCNWKQAVAIW